MGSNSYVHHFHVYECTRCIVTFAVEMAFEDQSVVSCPICQCNDQLDDISSGAMELDRRNDDE
ncbi:hypothetical protein [Peribacillus asahii]|uniref:hypothetical protein n=1 Tax=Peribacillus asahii TaxID=228899 RepID=UPI003800AFAC